MSDSNPSEQQAAPVSAAKNIFSQWEKSIGGLKFAVIIIALFTLCMITGTFLESYQGTEFANRMIYKTWPFMLIQFAMFLSILYAVFLRLPAKKHFYGFYVIHTGLILIGCGSVITYFAGIDGSITLLPNTPTRDITLSNDILVINYLDEGDTVTYRLPNNALESSIQDEYRDIRIKKFLPFSDNDKIWGKPSDSLATQSSEYLIFNQNVAQEFTLSLHPEAKEFGHGKELGPLSIHYLPEELGNCFLHIAKSKIIIWDLDTKTCYPPEQRKVLVKSTSKGKRFLVVKKGSEYLTFFPDFSPFPLTKDFNILRDASLRTFSLKPFEEGPQLFLFGKSAAYFENDKWSVYPLKLKTAEAEESENSLELPWMNFRLQLLKHSTIEIPINRPRFVYPVQKNGTLIKGGQKAVLVEAMGEDYWVTDARPVSLQIRGKRVNLQLAKESLRLPFEITLSKFKMDTNPGTENPASFESFINIFSAAGNESHHIFMNNPLKKDGLTFYQASYFPTEQGGTGSVLSVNVDQGRPIKYLGSILLVLGAIWHYRIRQKSKLKQRKSKTS